MECPECKKSMAKFGRTRYGVQRYRCRWCKISATGQETGRPPINDEPMSNIERQRRHQAIKKIFRDI
jgi:hypothetical protein